MQHEEAALRSSKRSIDINLRVFSVHLERRAPDYTNLRDLAMRSTEVVSDQTGDIATPGYYIRDQLVMYHGVFSPHMGWGGHVACYRGQTETSDGQGVFVALFGSASNVVGRRPNDDDTSEYYPSDISGLYSLLDVIREKEDPEIDLGYRSDDYAFSVEERAKIAMQFAIGGATERLGTLDFLAKVLVEVDDCRARDNGFRGRVILGAPIWIATPAPQPYPV